MSEVKSLGDALAWAAERGFGAQGRITPAEVRTLVQVLAGDVAFTPHHYDLLRAFAQACFRVSGAPPINVGDILEAFQAREVALPMLGAAWPPIPLPDPGSFAAFGFEEMSAGISRAQRNNREGWAAHATKCKALITQCLLQLDGTSAAVLGAGKVYDIPLKELVQRYKRLVLVDIDLGSLTETVKKVLGHVPAHVQLVQCDVTSVLQPFHQRLKACLDASADELSLYQSLNALLWSYNLEAPPSFFAGEAGAVDSVYSVMLLSQLATPATRALGEAFQQRYPNSKLLEQEDHQIALKQFSYRMQHDHVRALMSRSSSFALITDLAEQYVQLNAAGVVHATSPPLPMVAGERVDELIPMLGIRTPEGEQIEAQVLAATGWMWPRIAPKREGMRGSLMGVQAVVVRCLTPGARGGSG